MKTSDLIKILQDSISEHGDVDVKIESSYGEYDPRNIEVPRFYWDAIFFDVKRHRRKSAE